MRYFFFLLLLLPVAAFSQYNPQSQLTELGRQTSARGLVYYAPTKPWTRPRWKPNKDTSAYIWCDTTTSIRYEWNHAEDVWYTQGVIPKTDPPLATETYQGATIDNRRAFWISDANIIHYYNRASLAWLPAAGVIRAGSIPANVTASGSHGAAVYTTSLWSSTADDSLRQYIGSAWRVYFDGGGSGGGGSADNWGTQVVQTDGTLSGSGITSNRLKIAQQGATPGQVLKWNGSTWAPAADNNTGTTYTAGTGISINGSNVISASDASATNELQTLSIAGQSLSISSGNSVTIPSADGSETKVTAGSGVSVSGSGTAVSPYVVTNTGDLSSTNELQNLSLSGQSLGISSGSGVTLPIVGVNEGDGIQIADEGNGTFTLYNIGDIDASDDVTTAGGTTNKIAKFTSAHTVGNSQTTDNGTTVLIDAASSSPIAAAKLVVSKTHTNNSEPNLLLYGNFPSLGWRNTSASHYRFNVVTNYEGQQYLTFLSSSATNTNPTDIIGHIQNNGNLQFNGNLMYFPFASGVFGLAGSSFGSTTPDADAAVYFYVPQGKRVTYQAQSGLMYWQLKAPASGNQRNVTWVQSYYNPGFFTLLQSTTAGVDPSRNIINVGPEGNVAIGQNGTLPPTNAALSVESSTGAFFVPRMDTAHRDAMNPISDGAIIYNTEVGEFQKRKGGFWVNF